MAKIITAQEARDLTEKGIRFNLENHIEQLFASIDILIKKGKKYIIWGEELPEEIISILEKNKFFIDEIVIISEGENIKCKIISWYSQFELNKIKDFLKNSEDKEIIIYFIHNVQKIKIIPPEFKL